MTTVPEPEPTPDAAATATGWPDFCTLELATERLRLRPLRHADAPALFAIFSDPKVMRYWSTAPWTNLQPALKMIDSDAVAMAQAKHLRLGIELCHAEAATRSATSALIGTCTLFDLMPSCRRGEVGYALRADAWGHGYAHEALRALLAFGFMRLELNRVEADIDPRNQASVRAVERLGFVREGILRERWIVDGEVSDTALYGLLARDWMQRG